MGNDGGSIPTRRELVKEAAKSLNTTQVKEVQTEQQAHAWSNDPLTRKPLARPVVSDSAGTLYNKDSIIEFLLKPDEDADKAEQERVLQGRVRSLRDVVEVKFVVEDGAQSGLVEANGSMGRREKWVCPITGRELGPGAKAVYLVPCGCAFAGSVVREVSGEVCLQCNEPYAENDVIPILPTLSTDIARLNLRIKTLKEKGLTHALKKAPGSKKKRKHAEKEANGEAAEKSSKAKDSLSGEEKKNDKNAKDSSSGEDKKTDKESQEKSKPQTAISNGIKNSSTASLTRKVLEEQEQLNKRRKLGQNDNVKSLFHSRSTVPTANNSADYMTRGFSIGKK